MTRTVRVLGSPTIEQDGSRLPSPRGRKTWALLTYLLLGESAPSRHRLVALLFDEADDPQGALRWNLAELRRTIGAGLEGDPVSLELPDDMVVDALDDTGALASEGELLEGFDFSATPGFDAWLLVARRAVRARQEASSRAAALAALGSGRYVEAVTESAHAVELDPLNADHQTLLVRSLIAGGDPIAARAQAVRCAELFERELGVAPPPAVLGAVTADPTPTTSIVSPAVATSYLDAGRSAVSAGAVDRGLDQLRRAVAVAESVGDPGLLARTLVTLGSSMLHATGARDVECAEILHRGLDAAERAGATALACAASRELGFMGVQMGVHAQARVHLARAERLAGSDSEHAAVLGVRGMSLSDTARYPEALDVLTSSMTLAGRAGDHKRVAWSGALVGRIHVLRRDLDAAEDVLMRCMATVRDERWTAFRPFPQTFLGEVHLARGDLEQAEEDLQGAYVLSVELGDSCWTSVSARGLARLAACRDDRPAVRHWVQCGLEAPVWYSWVRGYLLEAACDLPLPAAQRRAHRTELFELASRRGYRELTVRALLHRAHDGEDGALAAAAGWDIDNPALVGLVHREEGRS